MMRSAKLEDAQKLSQIHNYCIFNTVITFEKTEINSGDMQKGILNGISKFPWIIYENNNGISSFAYLSDWRSIDTCKHDIESRIYLEQSALNQGVELLLHAELIYQLMQIWGFNLLLEEQPYHPNKILLPRN